MPSIRVKKSRFFYASLGDDTPDIPASPPTARQRSRSVVEVVSGAPLQSSPDDQYFATQGRRTRANTCTIPPEGQPSRVSQHIMNTGSWRSRDVPFLEHGRGNLSAHGSIQHASPLRNQRSGSTAVNDDRRHGRVDDAISIALSSSDHYQEDPEDHDEAVVDHLDVIDPQISTVSSLTNAANSIVMPPLSRYSWKPAVVLPTIQRTVSKVNQAEKGQPSGEIPENELDRHVEDVLRQRDNLRRTLMGVWSFLKTPLGVVTGIYGFCVVFWGAAIIFFLGKFINFHNADKQGFWVEVSSQVVNGLFTATGVGLIPWRVMDTYRILKIWYYKRRTRILRAKDGLPALLDEDDLPDPIYDPEYVHVLTDKEQRDLRYQQSQFMKSQTWYRPHGTTTHRAFPINTALLICFLIDWNSIFQIILCGTMWGLNRFQRPAWSTGILIPASFLCGILSGVFIWRGGKKTKRTAVVEERLRIALSTTPSQPTLGTLHIPRTHSDNHLTAASYVYRSPTSRTVSIAVDEYMTVPPNG